MTATLIDFEGFTSGGVEGLAKAKNATVETFDAPPKWTSKETYVLRMQNASTTVAESKSTTAGTYLTIGGWMYFDVLHGGTAHGFLHCNDAFPHLRLQTNASGDLLLVNAANAVVATASGVFAAARWYLVEVKFKWADSGDCRVWVNGNRVIEETSDFKNGTNNATAAFKNLMATDETRFQRVGSYYFIQDDGATIDTDDTRLGRYYVLGSYKSASHGTAGDFGDALTTGTWDNAQETPGLDANVAAYTPVGITSKQGGVSTDHATPPNGGPNGDTRLTGEIWGAKWAWRWKALADVGLGFRPFFAPKHGKTDPGSVGTDQTTTGASLEGDGTFQNLSIVSQAPPTAGQYFQIGFKADASVAEHGGAVTVADMWTALLVRDRKFRVLDGEVLLI